MAAKELMPKFKFLGISVDIDAQNTHYDYLLARNEEHALELLADLRPSCIPVSVFTTKELLELADFLIGKSETEIQEGMSELEKEAQS